MKSVRFLLVFALALAAGCSSGPCDDLAGAVSKRSGVSRDVVGPWLDSQLAGPDDQKLSDKQRKMACELLLDDEEALAGYTDKAKTDLASN